MVNDHVTNAKLRARTSGETLPAKRLNRHHSNSDPDVHGSAVAEGVGGEEVQGGIQGQFENQDVRLKGRRESGKGYGSIWVCMGVCIGYGYGISSMSVWVCIKYHVWYMMYGI